MLDKDPLKWISIDEILEIFVKNSKKKKKWEKMKIKEFLDIM